MSGLPSRFKKLEKEVDVLKSRLDVLLNHLSKTSIACDLDVEDDICEEVEYEEEIGDELVAEARTQETYEKRRRFIIVMLPVTTKRHLPHMPHLYAKKIEPLDGDIPSADVTWTTDIQEAFLYKSLTEAENVCPLIKMNKREGHNKGYLRPSPMEIIPDIEE